MIEGPQEPTPGTAVATVDAKPAAAIARAAVNPALGIFATPENFALAQRAAAALSTSELVPDAYKGKAANCLIAMDIANRIGVSPMTVMQNLHIISGRPSWGSPFIIGALNSCGRFSPLRFTVRSLGQKRVKYAVWSGPKGQKQKTERETVVEDIECIAWATELATGTKIEGPRISIEMAVREGWYTKSDSKWPTMPDLMLRYRAAAFFGRLYAPDVLMGMQTVEESNDLPPAVTLAPPADGAEQASVLVPEGQSSRLAALVATPPAPAPAAEAPSSSVAEATGVQIEPAGSGEDDGAGEGDDGSI